MIWKRGEGAGIKYIYGGGAAGNAMTRGVKSCDSAGRIECF